MRVCAVRSRKLTAYNTRQSNTDLVWSRLLDVLILQVNWSVPECRRHYFNYTRFLRYLQQFWVIVVLGVSIEDLENIFICCFP